MINIFKKKNKKPDPQKDYDDWIKAGRPLPPPHLYKQMVIKDYAEKYKLNTLVETGTYLGEMVEAQKNNFSKIYSIELSERLYRKAKAKFKSFTHITILQGNSGQVLKDLVQELNGPALFWLDGHYSGGITAMGDKECPVPEELQAIFKSDHQHMILIDDARLFNGEKSYPKLEELSFLITKDKYHLTNKEDIIRIVPL